MADQNKKVSDNVIGELFVDSTCINCGTCRKLAPETFGDNDRTSFVKAQPLTIEGEFRAMQALVACPVSAIGAITKKVSGEVLRSFPIEIEDRIFLNGFNAESSYGADSYFITSADDQNWMIDSPRFTPILVKAFEKLGGIKFIFLTHRDDVADAAKYAKHFGAKRIIHQLDLEACPDAEIVLSDKETFLDGAQIIHTPGHTRGHCVLLWAQKYLFTGDHLSWSSTANAFRPFRESCWHSWEEQIESVEKLKSLHPVEWILPGHGERKNILVGAFPEAVNRTTAWMKHR